MTAIKKPVYYFEYILVRIVSLVSYVISDGMRKCLARTLGLSYFHLSSKRRNIALDNLRHAFPEKSEHEIKKIAKESFCSMTITFLEMFLIAKWGEEDFKKRISFDNREQVIEDYRKKKGIIVVSGHYGNWELIAGAGKYFLGFNYLIPIKRMKNPYVDKLIEYIRTGSGNETVNMDQSALAIVRKIKKGGCVAMLADQSAHMGKDPFVKLFNRPTLTYKAPAEIALKFNVPFYEFFPERQKDGKYKVRIIKIDYSDLDYSPENVRKLTQRHVAVLENQLKRVPEQWAWMHRRWKHSDKYKPEPELNEKQ